MSDAEAAGGAGAEFDRLRRRAGLALGPTLFAALWLAPSGLPPTLQSLSAVLGLVMVLWISEAVPLAITALLGPALAILLGVAGPRDTLAPFADPVIFLFLGSFLLAEALRVHGLDRRVALWILSLPGAADSPARLRLALGGVTAALSMWISNTATAAMMLPIALGLARALNAAGSREPPRGMLLVVGISASLGGIATPVGTPPNLIALGFLERVGERSLSFLHFMALGLPLSFAMLGVAYLVVSRLVPTASAGNVAAHVARERVSLPAWSTGQTACAVAFGLAVTLWLLPGAVSALGVSPEARLARMTARLDEAVVALLAASLLFLWPVGGGRRALTWQEATRIDWGTLLLFGGGLSLGKLMFDTGLAEVLGRAAVAATGVESLWGLTALALLTSIVLTEVTSNTATVNMLAPLVLALARDLGVPIVPPLLAVAFGASMGFMFPIGTPPNAIIYGSGHVPMLAMMRTGVIVDLLSFFVILTALRLLCPPLGLM